MAARKSPAVSAWLVWLATFALGSTAAGADRVFQPDFHPALNVVTASGEIEIDGRLTDPGWRSAVRATGFAEIQPGDNTEPEVRSEALVTYDEANLYVALIAWDDPAKVRVSMSDRDNIFRDEYFGIMIDTYADFAWAYEIFVNPLGLQGDLRILSDGSEDISFDLVFDSRGIVTDSGYQVELAIPFASLRFPDRPEQTWRFNFWRDRQRDNRYKYSWAAQDRDNSCWFCQWGELTGLKDIKPGSNLDILPNVLAYQSGGRDDRSVPGSAFLNDDPDAELSINARYGLSSNSSLELSVNPDFSQVESDAGKIDVNETFALYYPERRPFFQEGSDLYQTFFNIVHTRTINDPILAGKYTGKFGRYSVAYLLARDDNTPLMVPLRERSAGTALESSTSNILRGRRTFGQDSYVGLVFTDRRTDGFDGESRVGSGSGSVAGVDTRVRLNRNYTVEFMAVASHTREPEAPDRIDTTLQDGLGQTDFDYGRHTVALDGESFDGHAVYAGLRRGGRYWSFTLDYRDFSPAFRADNGWIQGNDRQQVNFWTGVTFQPNREWLVEWGPRLSVGRVYNHRATLNLDPGTFNSGTRDEWFRPGLYFNFKGQTNVTVEYMASREWYRGLPFTGISRGFAGFSTRPWERIELGANFEYGRKVARYDLVMGHLTNIAAWANFKLTQRLRVSTDFDFSRLNHRPGYLAGSPNTDRTIHSGFILRTRITYQFTREWFLRLVVEYDDFGERLALEPLLTYQLNPFTVFYAGMTTNHQRYDASDYEDLLRTEWQLAQRQFFAKVQYLFRL